MTSTWSAATAAARTPATPSSRTGIVHKDVLSVIGNGCIVDPTVILEEIDHLKAEGLDCAGLRISGNAHIVMPWHKDLDGAHEKNLGKNLIGTTKRGIGPCYMDKMNRTGLRMQDMLDPARFREKVEASLAYQNPILEKVYGLPAYSVDAVCEEFAAYAERLNPYIVESGKLLTLECDRDIFFFHSRHIPPFLFHLHRLFLHRLFTDFKQRMREFLLLSHLLRRGPCAAHHLQRVIHSRQHFQLFTV